MNRTQEKLKQALITAGLSETQAKQRIEGFSGINVPSHISNTCPNCRSKMVDVLLVGERRARYCPNDRVVVPYPIDENFDNSYALSEYMKSTVSPNKDTASVFASLADENNNNNDNNKQPNFNRKYSY